MRRLRPPFRWSRRGLYLQPLVMEFWAQQLLGLAAGVTILVSWRLSGSVLVPMVATLAAVAGIVSMTLPFARSWLIWDLLVWQRRLAVPHAEPDQVSNVGCLDRASRALVARQFAAVRAELANLSSASPLVALVGQFYLGQADVLEGRQPDLEAFRRALSAVGADPTSEGQIMAGILEAGSEWLDDRDWRAPLKARRRGVGIRFSLLRALWPVRNQIVLLAAAPLVPWAYWLWGR